MAKARSPLQRLLTALVRFYQLTISPLTGPRCRFIPTCSTYAIEAVNVHGSIKGSWLATKRICRCHPFCEAGYDPVPPNVEKSRE